MYVCKFAILFVFCLFVCLLFVVLITLFILCNFLSFLCVFYLQKKNNKLINKFKKKEKTKVYIVIKY